MKSPLIKKIEFTLFKVRIPSIAADPSGFSVWYDPGPGIHQKRFSVKIYSDAGHVGEYVPPLFRKAACRAAAATKPACRWWPRRYGWVWMGWKTYSS